MFYIQKQHWLQNLALNRGAKWDAKVVAKMDPILDANTVLTQMPFRKQKWTLSREAITNALQEAK